MATFSIPVIVSCQHETLLLKRMVGRSVMIFFFLIALICCILEEHRPSIPSRFFVFIDIVGIVLVATIFVGILRVIVASIA